MKNEPFLTEEEKEHFEKIHSIAFLDFLFDHMNPNEMEDYISMYLSADGAAVADDGTRIVAYEHAIYIPGYITKKGEIVRFDYNGDNTYDLLRYDGGSSETALAPGRIDGWHVVDADGNILGTYYNGEFMPVK